MSDGHNHCWHAMGGNTPEEHFYACCRGGCEDVMAAGRREFEEKSHGLIGWEPGRVHRPAPRTPGPCTCPPSGSWHQEECPANTYTHPSR